MTLYFYLYTRHIFICRKVSLLCQKNPIFKSD